MDLVPAAMFIEMAQDALKNKDPEQVKRELKELEFATGESNADINHGYQLGLETMRVYAVQSRELGLEKMAPPK